MNNTASFNGVGIYLTNSQNNAITENTVIDNLGWEFSGIYLSQSDANNISFNNIVNNVHGVHLIYSNGNSITHNTISDCNEGILIGFSSSNTVNTNEVNDAGGWSIRLVVSNSNVIYDNKFDTASDNGNNVWNTTKTSGTNIIGGSSFGGNFWNDYTGVDEDGDGLGDTMLPYTAGGPSLPVATGQPLITLNPAVKPVALLVLDATSLNIEEEHILDVLRQDFPVDIPGCRGFYAFPRIFGSLYAGEPGAGSV